MKRWLIPVAIGASVLGGVASACAADQTISRTLKLDEPAVDQFQIRRPTPGWSWAIAKQPGCGKFTLFMSGSWNTPDYNVKFDPAGCFGSPSDAVLKEKFPDNQGTKPPGGDTITVHYSFLGDLGWGAFT